MIPTRISMLLPAVILAAASASAQSFNMDINQVFGAPTSSYGAAAGQAGVWNALDGGSGGQTGGPFTLLDLSGVSTSVTASFLKYGNGTGNFSFNNLLTTGDDQALMDDFQDVGSGTSIVFWTFENLAPSTYEVYTYAWAADDPFAYFAFVSVPGSGTGQTQVGGADWSGAHVLGVTYAKHTVTIGVSGQLQILVEAQPNFGFCSLNGFQIVDVGGGGGAPTYCTARVTSCGSTPAMSGPTGTLSLSAGAGSFDVTLLGVPDASNGGGPAVLIHGPTAAPSGSPTTFGLLCVSGFFRGPAVGPPAAGGPGSCDGVYTWDFGGYASANAGSFALLAGNPLNVQGWARDPNNSVNPPGGTANFSDAIGPLNLVP